MARGNQRDKAREKAQKAAAGVVRLERLGNIDALSVFVWLMCVVEKQERNVREPNVEE